MTTEPTAAAEESAETPPNPDLVRLKTRGPGYDPDFYRRPIGWAVLLVVLILFGLAWIFVEIG